MMTAEASSFAGWPALMPTIAECVTQLGSEHFDDCLLTLLRQGMGIAQCIVFAYSGNDDVDCLLVNNPHYPRVAGRLATLYADGLFRQDPHYPRLRRLVGRDIHEVDIIAMPMCAEDMSPAYRRHLFALPELADKVSLAIPAGATVYYLNLYRDIDHGVFTAADLERLNTLAPLLASLICRHYRQARPAALPPSHEEAEVLAPLSERERQLCLRLLRGHTLKTAARQLGIALSTAETYRKRAYAKLGVTSKVGMVAMCRRV